MRRRTQAVLGLASVIASAAYGQTPEATTVASSKVYYACYQASAGIVYRIREPGLPDECRGPSHIMFSWTDATGAIVAGASAAGDLAGTYPNPAVVGLHGRSISSAAPNTGDVLGYNGTNWSPTPITFSGPAGGDLRGAYPNPSIGHFLGVATPLLQLLQPVSGSVPMVDAGVWTAQPLSGDITGGANSTFLRNIQGRSISVPSPTNGQVLTFNAGLGSWVSGNITLPTASVTNAQLANSSFCVNPGVGLSASPGCVALGQTLNLTSTAGTDLTNFKQQLSSQGTLNSTTNPIDWTELKNVPPAITSGGTSQGLVGYEIQTFDREFSQAHNPLTAATAVCSPGKKALGGSVSIQSSTGAQLGEVVVQVLRSNPFPDGSAWAFDVVVTLPPDATAVLRFYATCATAQ